MASLFAKRRIKRSAGHVVDYCPVCHEITVAEFFNVDWGRRALFIPLGRPVFLGSMIRCTVCSMQSASHDHRYTSIEKKRPQNLQALIQATFPTVHDAYAPQMAFEKLLQDGLPLVPEDRFRLLAEPLILLNGSVSELYSGEVVMDKQVGFGLLLCVLLLGATILLAADPFRFLQHMDAWSNLVLGSGIGFFLALFYSGIQLRRSKGRILRKKFCPSMAKSLVRLNPTREEIAKSIGNCKGQGLFIGHILKTDDLWKALEKANAPERLAAPQGAIS